MTNEELDKLEELERRATKAPWELQDGCSWRRFGTPGHDGNVLCPEKNRHDGHPDLRGSYDNFNAIIALRNSAPTLIALAREALAARKATAKVSDGRSGHPNHSHRKPATWDDTNTPCHECFAWMEYQRIRTANEKGGTLK